MTGLTSAVARFTIAATLGPDRNMLSERVARLFADTIAVAVAGERSHAFRLFQSAHQPIPPGPCGIFGNQIRTDMRTAALFNGFAAHALDYDDVSEISYTHPSATVIPVITAIADAGDITRAQAVESYAIAFQVESALAKALPIRRAYGRGWHASGVLGPITAAVAASRLFGLNESQTVHALGLAVANAGGSLANFGSMTKPLTIARSASDGLWAAVLAQRGITSGEDALGGPGGLLEMFGSKDQGNVVADALNLPWALKNHGPDLKPYPACSAARCAIDAARAINVDPEQIIAVNVAVEPRGLEALRYDRPRTADEARFSMSTLVALALLDGDVSERSFTAASLDRASLRRLAACVSSSTHSVPPLGPLQWRDAFAVVEVTTRDEEPLRLRADAPHGAVWPWEQVRHKFEACTSHHDDEAYWWNAATALADPILLGGTFRMHHPD